MAKDCQGLTVHAVSFVHRRGPVFYASLPYGPCATETLKGCGANGAEDKNHLISALWDHLVAMESPLWKRCQSSNRAAFPIQVVRGLFGRPHLLLGEYRGPAISFSESGGKVWAALCGDESDIGIDVAGMHRKPVPFDERNSRHERLILRSPLSYPFPSFPICLLSGP